MTNFKYVIFAIFIGAISLSVSAFGGENFRCDKSFVIASDYMPLDGKTDVTAAVQKLIDDNPNRTIFFPDGTYKISASIKTPALPSRSVSLVFDNYAVLKASENWKSKTAMIQMGGTHPSRNINEAGSNYGLSGGIIDGAGKADGISIDSGRETFIRGCSIKNTKVGIHIKYGSNSGSSDADIRDVNIVGNNSPDSVGIIIDGHDNTITNARICAVSTGVSINSGGNSLRNIHPLYRFIKGESRQKHYENGCAFSINKGFNWFYYCYSDQFATGFKMKSAHGIFNSCFSFWYTGEGGIQTAFETFVKLDAIITDFRVVFHPKSKINTILKAEKGGQGVFQNLVASGKYAPDDAVFQYLSGKLVK